MQRPPVMQTSGVEAEPVGDAQQVEPPAGQIVQGHVVHEMAGAYVRHVPPMHCWFELHALLQPPQFSGSFAKFTHAEFVAPPAVHWKNVKPPVRHTPLA